ncbi:MAG: hypothetical protein R8L53_02420 [Mariprofundales bacterium]
MDTMQKQQSLLSQLKDNFSNKKNTLEQYMVALLTLYSIASNIPETHLLNLYNQELYDQIIATAWMKDIQANQHTNKTMNALYGQIAELTSNKMSISHALQRMQQTWDDDISGVSKLSDLEQQAHKRQSERLLNDEDGWLETILGLLPSSDKGGEQELMLAYYAELVILNKRDKNITAMNVSNERLITLSEEELQALTQIMPLLATQIKQLKTNYAEYWARINMQIKPDAAVEILKRFEGEYGYYFPVPLPLDKSAITTAIEDWSNDLFNSIHCH